MTDDVSDTILKLVTTELIETKKLVEYQCDEILYLMIFLCEKNLRDEYLDFQYKRDLEKRKRMEEKEG